MPLNLHTSRWYRWRCHPTFRDHGYDYSKLINGQDLAAGQLVLLSHFCRLAAVKLEKTINGYQFY